jgi:hypothetical protein
VIFSLAGPEQFLELMDIAVMVRLQVRTLSLNGDLLSVAKYLIAHSLLGALTGFALEASIVREEAMALLFDLALPKCLTLCTLATISSKKSRT